VDLVGPIPQAFRMALGGSAFAAIIVPFAVAAASARSVANSSVLFTATTRMPMVAGWDNLMPAWFARLHPRYKTPVNSILFIGACGLAFAALGLTNVGEQEAYQLLDNAAGILYGLTYLVLFAVPLFGLRTYAERVPGWLRAAAALGFATTTGYVILSIFPIVDVPSTASFALKISAVVILTNVIGTALYLRKRRA
jgi:amino acid transporter